MRTLLTTIFLFISLVINAMGFDDAKEHALFIADKLKYELNLTDEQYEKCYEAYLDYFISVNTEEDLYSDAFELRNEILQSILLDYQWNYLFNALYFYRPLYWYDGFWHMPIYYRYPMRHYFIYGRPKVYKRPPMHRSHISRPHTRYNRPSRITKSHVRTFPRGRR